jgi:hypothetical protein
MKTFWKRWIGKARQLTAPRLALAAATSLALALALSACENVAGYTQPSLVRVIDASFIAGAVNIYVEDVLLAGNIGEGYVSNYGTLPASGDALIKVTGASGGATLVSSHGTLLAGHQHSVFLTDNGVAPTSYNVTVLEDQMIAAAGGQVDFRFLNQAPRTGANGVDVYMVPAGATLATANLLTTVPLGTAIGYISVPAEPLTMYIAPSGQTVVYTKQALTLTSGQVFTVLIIDSQLTNTPPQVLIVADDQPTD